MITELLKPQREYKKEDLYEEAKLAKLDAAQLRTQREALIGELQRLTQVATVRFIGGVVMGLVVGLSIGLLK